MNKKMCPEYAGCDDCDPIRLLQEMYYENPDLLETAITALKCLEYNAYKSKKLYYKRKMINRIIRKLNKLKD